MKTELLEVKLRVKLDFWEVKKRHMDEKRNLP
jgi:hypothetical protein